ncbi:hypothetical protein MGG_14438 [Pyricularia oryzae 70-15]|uniref:Uncharacterized protein n=1 Tax=Pyricularia oryzae (strain 70-15 / ATCC MYA-4617 / FGSC 8958) TaxID=242507 RepID=G4NFE5_PYRO7|nr:uncharacterized protein MGG_14438 [Pyricularia oryzae 70-15]EHA47173.1 hypothetical protein MGG_14438 [Pyricularia oryzae 70-15]
MSGQVKIWSYENCQPMQQEGTDIRSLSNIMMDLMQGYCKDEGRVGLDNLEGWPNSLAVEFLSATAGASSLDELSQVRFRPLCFQKEHILSSTAFVTQTTMGPNLVRGRCKSDVNLGEAKSRFTFCKYRYKLGIYLFEIEELCYNTC